MLDTVITQLTEILTAQESQSRDFEPEDDW